MNNTLFLKPLAIDSKSKKRIGGEYDGGYVVYIPALNKSDLLLTYGVGFDYEFEEHFNEITSQKVLMFDPTMFGKYLFEYKHFMGLISKLKLIKSFRYIQFAYYCYKEQSRLKQKNIFFINEGISAKKYAEKVNMSNGYYFYFLKAHIKLKKKCEYDSLKSHIQKFNLTEKNILLKIDIEESEYAIFLDDAFYGSLDNVNQIIVEFHNLKNRLEDLKKITDRLSKEYYLVHIHGNNFGETFKINNELNNFFPDTVEITWIRKNELNPKDIIDSDINYPVEGLDFPNHGKKKDYNLIFS